MSGGFAKNYLTAASLHPPGLTVSQAEARPAGVAEAPSTKPSTVAAAHEAAIRTTPMGPRLPLPHHTPAHATGISCSVT